MFVEGSVESVESVAADVEKIYTFRYVCGVVSLRGGVVG